jgi:hypothetical protein
VRAPKGSPEAIDDYIAEFPTEVQRILEQMRAAVRKQLWRR